MHDNAAIAKQVPTIGFNADLKEVILFSSSTVVAGNAEEDIFKWGDVECRYTCAMKLMYSTE